MDMPVCTFIDSSVQRETSIFTMAERFYQEGRKAVIYTGSDDRANELDRFLWVSKQESFIPHKIFNYEEMNAPEPIAIVSKEINPIAADILIADGLCSLPFASGFSTIIEFVNRDSAKELQKSRARYKAYKDRPQEFTLEHTKS